MAGYEAFTTGFRQMFSDRYEDLFEQKRSLVMGNVTQENIDGSVGYFSFIGPAGAFAPAEAGIEDTNLDEINVFRRLIKPKRFDKYIPIKEWVVDRMIADPTGNIMMELQRQAWREIDTKCFLNSIGVATAVSGDLQVFTAVSLPATQMITESGTVGLTLNKLLQGMTQFSLNEMVDEEEPIICAISPLGRENLLKDPVVKLNHNAEISLRALKYGQVLEFYGVQLKLSNRLPKTGNIRSAVMWVKSGIKYGIKRAYGAALEPRYDKKSIWQAHAWMDYDVQRGMETHVVQVQYYEDPSRQATVITV